MDRPTETPGFTIPVHRSLTEPMLVAGAPRGATIFNGTLAVALGLGMHAWLAAVVIWVFVQGACVLAARRDPQFIDVLRRHVRQPDALSC